MDPSRKLIRRLRGIGALWVSGWKQIIRSTRIAQRHNPNARTWKVHSRSLDVSLWSLGRAPYVWMLENALSSEGGVRTPWWSRGGAGNNGSPSHIGRLHLIWERERDKLFMYALYFPRIARVGEKIKKRGTRPPSPRTALGFYRGSIPTRGVLIEVPESLPGIVSQRCSIFLRLLPEC